MTARTGIALAASVGLHVGALVWFGTTAPASALPHVVPQAEPEQWVRVDVVTRTPHLAEPEPHVFQPEPVEGHVAEAKRAIQSERRTAAPKPVEGRAAEATRNVEPEHAAATPEPTSAQPERTSVQPEPVEGGTSSSTSRSATNLGAGSTSPSTGGAVTSAASPESPSQRPLDLTALHNRLSAAARSCYPPAAKRFRLQGIVPVHFCIDGRGSLTRVDRQRSSGSTLLDRAALECVLPGAAPLPGPAGCYDVSVEFR